LNVLLILPILIPFVAAIISLIAWRSIRVQTVLSVAAGAGLLAAGLVLLYDVWHHGIRAAQMGSWPAPFGITLVADTFSAIMVVMAGLIGCVVAVYSLEGIDRSRKSFGYYPLLFILLMGVNGAFLTGDVFNLYVWFEVMLIASFVLMALGGSRAQLEGAFKYVTLNLMASALFLAAVGILYGIAGTLNMADLAQRTRDVSHPGTLTTVAMMFLVAFGIKAAVFPLFFWLPASYHTPPPAVSAVFAGLLTKVGVYALIRAFTLLFVQDTGYTHGLLLVLAAFTMVTGVLGAVAQNDFRRLLSFHIISQIGYMIMGLAIWSPLALAGSVFYLVHNIIAKTNLFLIAGVVGRLRGTEDLKKLGGLYRTRPVLSVLFLVSALGLAGLPPLSGFWAKFVLVKAGLDSGQYMIVAVALGVSLLTLFSMTKIWAQAFWKDAPGNTADEPLSRAAWWSFGIPIVVLAVLTAAIGLAFEPVFQLSMRASEQLLDPAAYIAAVLGPGGGP
jgi:multicomponent Na+:H+ antiporter subunit D